MNKQCLAIVVGILALVVGVAGWFFVKGNATKAEDGRYAIHLSPGERALVLSEMRAFLVGTQQILAAAANDDSAGVAAAAKSVGRAAAHEVPPTLMAKLPLEFKQLGMSVHDSFDSLALDAPQFTAPKDTLNAMSGILQKCVACHASFQLVTDGPK